MIRFLHGADFHLDSAFGALPAQRAAERRRESRELLFRLADYVNGHDIDLVLLAGDLFDSASPFRETGEQLAAALGQMRARVFVAPGNHDWYGPGSPWETRACWRASPPRRTGRSTSACSTGSWTERRTGMTPSGGKRYRPAALPIWPWATSTSGWSL